MKQVKIFRELAGLSQQQVADALSISQQAYAKYETGESNPRADKLPELAKALNCTIDDLFREE